MICGGTEAAVTPLGIAGFFGDARACRRETTSPNARAARGTRTAMAFVVGEGAPAFCVLEEYEHASERRGATVLAGVGRIRHDAPMRITSRRRLRTANGVCAGA